jgi:hypothetical protein
MRPMHLQINAAAHATPDTRYTKQQMADLEDRIVDAPRDQLPEIIEEILAHQLNEYHVRELRNLAHYAEKPSYKLSEIKSALRGVLMKLTPSGQTGGSSSAFRFRSVQVHGTMKNGKRKTRTNTVVVKGSKGTKTVEIHDSTKKRKTYRSTKRLTAREISNIKRNKFMPGLFRDL